MKDLLHDHLTFGFHDGCPACDQTKAVFRNQGLAELPVPEREVRVCTRGLVLTR